VIYPAQTYAVNRLLFGGSLSYEKLAGIEWTWEAVKSLGFEAMASFFLGGLFLALVLSPVTYFLVRNIVVRCRSSRKAQ
jgi:uncharacterized protein (DUF2062 family)